MNDQAPNSSRRRVQQTKGDDERSEDRAASLTWAALLAQWTRLAQAARALPEGADDPHKWKAVVSDVIALQATWFALGDLGKLDEAERRLAVDRAQVLIERSKANIRRYWPEGVPDSLASLIEDAQARLDAIESALRPRPGAYNE